jgi:hypothetical protein
MAHASNKLKVQVPNCAPYHRKVEISAINQLCNRVKQILLSNLSVKGNTRRYFPVTFHLPVRGTLHSKLRTAFTGHILLECIACDLLQHSGRTNIPYSLAGTVTEHREAHLRASKQLLDDWVPPIRRYLDIGLSDTNRYLYLFPILRSQTYKIRFESPTFQPLRVLQHSQRPINRSSTYHVQSRVFQQA